LALMACSKLAGFEHIEGATGEGGDGSSLPSSGNAHGGARAGDGGSSGETTNGGATNGGGRNTAGQSGADVSGSSQGARGGSETSPSGGSTPTPSGGSGGAPASGGTMNGGTADFEQGRRVWSEYSRFAPNFEIIKPRDAAGLTALGVTPQAGNYLAWLGGIPDDDHESFYTTLTQDVTVPTEAGSVRMTGSIWIVSDEPTPGADYLVAELYDGDTLCWLVHWWDTDVANGGWLAFDYQTSDSDQMRCMRGKTLTLSIESRQDPNVKTSFFMDSLRLVANCAH
jgi:hypothetical protein